MAEAWSKKLRRVFRDRVAPWLAALAGHAYGAYGRLLRYRLANMNIIDDLRARGPIILVHWHGDDLALLNAFAHQGYTVMISRSADGEILARGMKAMGFGAVRASSSRDAVKGLKEMVSLVRAGHSVVITVDGPSGPARRVKSGAVMLAKLTGAPLVVGGVAADRKWVFRKSWHQTYIPKPLARIQVLVGQAVWVEADASADDIEAIRARIEGLMLDFHEEANRLLG